MTVWWGFGAVILRVLVGGWPWAVSRTGRENGFWVRATYTLAAGFLVNLLPAVVLAPFGLWTPAADWVAWAVLAGLGWASAFLHTQGGRLRLQGFLAAMLTAGAIGSVGIALPLRSEWLAGGWDPGIYQNSAVAIADRDGLTPEANTIYTAMEPDERTLFARSSETYHEIMPGVPIDITDGSLPFYFFPLTPLTGAWLFRLGGMELLNRQPMLLGFWLLIPMLGLLQQFGASRTGFLCGVVALLSSPLWWYQQAVPTSEMLYLFLLLSALVLYVDSAQKGSVPLMLGLVLFAATVNHFNVTVVAALMLLAAAVMERYAGVPSGIRRSAACFAAVAAGMCYDLVVASVTIVRLQEKDRILDIIFPVFFGAAAATLAAAAWPRRPRVSRVWIDRGRAALAAILVLAGLSTLGLMAPAARDIAGKILNGLPFLDAAMERWIRLTIFQGALRWAAAFVVLAWMLFPAKDRTTGPAPAAWTLALLSAVLLASPGITPIYPWALRRYVIACFPLLALACALLPVRAYTSMRGRPAGLRLAVAAFAALPLVQGAVLSLDAGRVGDYRGMAAFLQEIEASFRPGDVVIADDPRWGTPVLLQFGCDVISGRRLWRASDEADRKRLLAVLDRLRTAGDRRFLWLTSTSDRMGLYKIDVGKLRVLWEDRPFNYEIIDHSVRAKSFRAEEKKKIFALYEWTGSPEE